MRRFRGRTVQATAFGVMAVLACGAAITHSAQDDASAILKDAIDGGRAQNVILFIGDGMKRPFPQKPRRGLRLLLTSDLTAFV